MRKLLFLVLFIFVVYYSNGQLIKISLEQRVDKSDLIVEGKVTGQRSFWNRDQTMIYTASTVEIFKIFKGNVSSSLIEIITPGGIVGDRMIKVKPSVALAIGDLGIFTCERIRQSKLNLGQSFLPRYELYASVQGFIQYDLHTQAAKDVFNKWHDIDRLYKKFLPKGIDNYKEIKHFDIYTKSEPSPLVSGFSASELSAGTGNAARYPALRNSGAYSSSNASISIAAITGFSPTSVSAGTGNTITITGNGFGATQGSGVVSFRNADDGGATFVQPLPSQYVSWSDTQIIVQVPQNAGTGTIQVTQGTTATSATPLTITFNHLNVNFDPGPGTLAYLVDHIDDNGSGGYTFRMNTAFDANADAKASMIRAMETWRCNDGMNWKLGATTSISNGVSDGTNIITFDDASPLSAGVLGLGISYYSGCASGPTIEWYVNEMDFVVDNGSNISPLTWEYGPSAPSASEYDFESLCLQQLGRLHQLGYVIDPSAVMHYQLASGVSKRSLTTGDIAGANFVQARSIVANVCGPGPMVANPCNTAPTDIALSNTALDENVAGNTSVGTFSTTDPDAANTFTYTLVAGTGDTDNGSFTISGNSLLITNSPDFETKGSYSIRIRTTDQGSLSYEEVFNITINNLNETPTDLTLSANTINENVTGNSTIGSFTTTDPDAANTFTYTLVAGTGDDDNGSFNISGGNLRITNSPDFETKSSYSVRIRTTDQGGLSYEEAFTITINNLNEAPTDITLSASSIDENVTGNSTVATFTTTDPDAANTFTYTLVAGTGDTDNGSFNISGGNLRITNSPDFETKNSYSIRVRATDQGSLSFSKVFTITINNVNEAPADMALSASSIDEGVAANTAVGTFSTTDPDASNTFAYTLVAGTGDTDNGSFNISGNNLRITNIPDFETKSSYSIRIRTTDQGSLSYEEAFTIIVNNLNEVPTDISLSASSINENVAGNSTVGTFNATDPDAANTFTYTLVSGTGDTDNGSFNISGNSLRIINSPDFETKSSYSIRVRATDQGSLSYEEVFTVTINSVNEAPTGISLSASSVNEAVADNATVGTFTTVDPDAANTFTYTLAAGTGDGDNASFSISGNSLRITHSPDFETKSSYNIRIRVTDQGGLSYEETFTIIINNLNEAPTDISLSPFSIKEGVAANTTVGTFSTTDPDASNTFAYTLAAGTGDTDNGSFNISGNNLRITNSPDFETKSSYNIRIRTTDQGGLSYEEPFTIAVTNVNEAPTDLLLDPDNVDENAAPNTVVGVLTASHPDPGNSFAYSLVAGTGDQDNASFNINASELRIMESPDFETKESYAIRIRATDQDGLFIEKTFTIAVNDLEEEVEINNYMSPNGDGKNDRWEIRGNDHFRECDIRILDRQGNTVYRSKGYNNTWEGTKNGEQLPAGVYYYVITCSGKESVTGDITLIR